MQTDCVHLPDTFNFDWQKELILVRGLPGSGKSTLGSLLGGQRPGSKERPPTLVESDMYFMLDGRYVWAKPMLSMAHHWCRAEAFRRLRFLDRVVVANVFAKRDQILPYIEQARTLKCRVWLLEPEGIRLPVEALAARNTHGVPLERIQEMKNSWEKMSQQEVCILLDLPEPLRKLPLTVPSFDVEEEAPQPFSKETGHV